MNHSEKTTMYTRTAKPRTIENYAEKYNAPPADLPDSLRSMSLPPVRDRRLESARRTASYFRRARASLALRMASMKGPVFLEASNLSQPSSRAVRAQSGVGEKNKCF